VNLTDILTSRLSKSQAEHLTWLLELILWKVNEMANGFDALTAQVAANNSVVESALTLIQGLADQIKALIAAGNNDPALQALADSLSAEDAKLAAAVAANTPTPPAPAPAP
jgi:hypothetical protein